MKISKFGKGILAFTFVLLSFFDSTIIAAETASQTTAEKVNFQSYSAGQWKSGQQIYQAFCIHCHQTNIGPALLGRQYPPAALTIIVRNGMNTMPTFRTSEINNSELAMLAKWIEQTAAPNSDVTAGASGGTK